MMPIEATFVEEVKVSPMPRRNRQAQPGRRFTRRWPALATVAFLLVSAFAGALQASALQRYLLESWMKDLEQRGGLHIEMSEYAWSWPFRLVIGKAEVIRHGRTMLHCERATLTFSPSLERPFWCVSNLLLDRPVFYLEKDRSGRWIAPAQTTGAPGLTQSPREPASSRVSSRAITVRVQSGAIVAHQDGQQVLRVGNVTGQLTLPHDGAAGISSLLANIERLRPAAPRELSLRNMNTDLPHRADH